eukprot:CAMPEP_0206458388 /NCGR_PEP_ID=MMETSP0324_2-20121206/23539_1 /ASSEMBLY_ACC=CAM_ASM_000836 /TAXON_ID=2866 /ORGANISM="Crypthecodinium cohnii, Strain Seligo" /LENGTH=337 /DNA_ID=CAMNT_0053929715 /DNA_START=56 /DNA_END=1069 /DNA_ORIENTATION=-
MPIRTALTDMLGIEHPIIQGGMQYVGYAEIAAAVSNAGGLGVLTALTQPTPEDLRKEIKRCRSMTDKPFGVNLALLPMLIPADYDAYAKVIAEEKIAMVEVAAGSPRKYVPMWHAAGIKVLHKSASIRHALKAQADGVDLIEVIGNEGAFAGGQPGDEVAGWVLFAKAVKMLQVPVIHCGATATGRQVAAALAMGAAGCTMGTRFLATVECPIRQEIKEKMAEPKVDERCTSVVLSSLKNATRVFTNDVSKQMLAIEKEMEGGKKDFKKMAPYASGARTKKMWQQTGDYNDGMWSASQSLGLIDDIPTCKDLLDRIIDEAEECMQAASAKIIPKSKL